MKKTVILWISILFIMACGGKNHLNDDHDHSHEQAQQTQENDDHDHSSDHGENGHEDENEIPVSDHDTEDLHFRLHLSDQVIKQWKISLSSPQIRNRIEIVQMNGVVRLNENATFLINSLVSGIVVAIKKDLGDIVRRGEVLCVLNSPELLELKTKYVKAYQDYLRSKEDYERARTLFAIKAIEKKSFMNRETTYKIAAAEYFSLDAQLGVICLNEKGFVRIKNALQKDDENGLKAFLTPFFPIPSPGSGKVLDRFLHLGEMVENNRKIYEISDTRQIWIILDAMERDLRYLKKGDVVEIQADAYPGELFSGRIMNIKEPLDPESRTIKIRVEVDNRGGRLKPNMFVVANLEKRNLGKYPAVPSSAIVRISDVSGVFIKDGDGFAFNPVKIVDSDSTGYVYGIGLSVNQQVVVNGAFYLKAEFELKRGAPTDSHAGHQH
jgi:cobalt-zinc-cadmium efflux system membrane fusion protein